MGSGDQADPLSYEKLLRPLLFRADAETAHRRVMAALALANRWGPQCSAPLPQLPGAPIQLFGLEFSGPIGLAAGLDKDGEAWRLWPALGFGFAEIGTVTPRPQPGNPRPRLFRLPASEALINRMGFNSAGAQAVAERLPPRGTSAIPLGVNVGKNRATPLEGAADDLCQAIEALVDRADYLVINVSSPNTPDLRRLQSPRAVAELVRQCLAVANGAPLLVKVAPDFEPGELEETATAAVDAGCAGLIAANTTTTRHGLAAQDPSAAEQGGLSGAPLRELATAAVQRAWSAVGQRVPIIGVGGISTAEHSLEKLSAGASLLQVYTGLIYGGPGLVPRIHRELAELLRERGLTWLQAIGHKNHA